MAMKGGPPASKTLIVDMPDLQDPSGESGGTLSPARLASTLFRNQGPETLRQVVEQCASVLGTLSVTELENKIRQLMREIQHPETGLVSLLSEYPQGDEDLDREIETAAVEVFACMEVQEQYETALDREQGASQPDRHETLEHIAKAYLDHAVPALYHFTRADERYRASYPAEKSRLPDFMRDIDTGLADYLQDMLRIKPKDRVIDVTETINVALAGSVRDKEKFGHIGLLVPPPLTTRSETEKKKATRREFEDMLDAFRDGAMGLDDMRGYLVQLDDAVMRQELEIRLRKAALRRLEEHGNTPALTMTDDEKKHLEDFTQTDPGPDPAVALWIQKLEKDIEQNAPKAVEILNLIQEGPSAPHKDEAEHIAKDMARAYADVQMALQDYKIDQTPESFMALTEALECLPRAEQPAALEVLALYDREAARIEIEQYAAVEAQQMDIAQAYAPQSSHENPDTSPSAPAASMGMGGGMGGGFA